MIIEDYGEVSFEIGDVLIDDDGDLFILLSGHWAHCDIWSLTSIYGYHTCRTEWVETYKKVGHVTEIALQAIAKDRNTKAERAMKANRHGDTHGKAE